MKYTLAVLVTVITLMAYGQNIHSGFPKKIQTDKTTQHTRVKGSKVFAVFPETYQYIDVISRYQKSEKLYIQIFEITGASIFAFKEKYNREAIEAEGAEVDLLQDITINEFEGIYGEGPSKFPGETKIMLTFGDSDFIVMIGGVLKTSDAAGKKELQEIFKSVYYEKSYKLDPLELAAFEFDTSITGFKYETTISNMYVYSTNDTTDVNNSSDNAILITMMPSMPDYKAEMYLNDVIWRYRQGEMILENTDIKKATINEFSAFVWTTQVLKNNKEGILYVVVLVGKDKSVVFIGNAFEDVEDFLSKYKRTVETIKIK